jgi:hypothetical protein
MGPAAAPHRICRGLQLHRRGSDRTRFQVPNPCGNSRGRIPGPGWGGLGSQTVSRHPLPFSIGSSQGDLSLYYIRRQYVDAFIARDDLDPLEIRYTNEIGFTFGTTPKVKLWIVRLPRIGLGYRWGPNARGVRLNFGFPF